VFLDVVRASIPAHSKMTTEERSTVLHKFVEYQVVAQKVADGVFTPVVYLETYDKGGVPTVVFSDGNGMEESPAATAPLVPMYVDGELYLGQMISIMRALVEDAGVQTQTHRQLMELVADAAISSLMDGAVRG
jgi:hypothetical protein